MTGADQLARVTAWATLGLIVAGGIVTNTGAALAVPDWPTTFGHNMFRYPWSQMVGGVLVEHGHRLFGALVGLLTLGLGVAVWLTDRRRFVRVLAVSAVGLVSIQGVVGGLRVLLLEDTLAIVHGSVAPAFFALVVTLAVVTGRAWRGDHGVPPAADRGVTFLATLGVLLLYGQIVLGALTTHGGWVVWHIGGAVVVTAGVAVLAARATAGTAGGTAVAWWARRLGGLLAVQLTLGVLAYASRFTDLAVPGGQLAAVALPVAHRAVGALLFGGAVALVLHAWRAHRAIPGARRASLVSSEAPA